MQHQTLQDKYPHLEVSVLKLSEVKKDNESFRIDSEYLRQEYLYLKNILLQKPYEYLSQLVSYNSRYSQPIYDDKSKMKVINSQYIRNEFIDYENAKTGYGKVVPKESVLINSTGIGTLGRVNINLLDFDFSIDSHINVLVIKDRAILNPYFLMIFLQTKYGQSQINRYYSGTSGQIEIYPKDFNYFIIPIFPMPFQLEIEKLVKDSHKALESSKALYKEAESLLYESLGLDSKNPLASILESKITDYHDLQGKSCDDNALSPNYTIATLKESFLKTGRLDAEYYQEKYYIMEEKLKKNGFVILDEICSLINYGSVPTSPYTDNGEGIPYIKGLNLKKLQVDENKLDRITNTKDLDSKFFTKENDIIISQMGTVGDVGVVSKDQENYVFASFTIRIRLKDTQKFNPYFVAIYIQHIAKEWYLFRNIAQASVRQNTDLPTIKNLYVPIVDSTTQAQIATYIQKSFELRAKAKSLLESAKAEVESALNNANNGGGGVKPS